MINDFKQKLWNSCARKWKYADKDSKWEYKNDSVEWMCLEISFFFYSLPYGIQFENDDGMTARMLARYYRAGIQFTLPFFFLIYTMTTKFKRTEKKTEERSNAKDKRTFILRWDKIWNRFERCSNRIVRAGQLQTYWQFSERFCDVPFQFRSKPTNSV